MKLGWHFIGRLQGLVQYDAGDGFNRLEKLFEQASPVPVTKTSRRDNSFLSKKRSKSSRLLLVHISSLIHAEEIVVTFYKMRMTIEESFRDTKCNKYGLGLNDNINLNERRYVNWLILSAIATLVAWILGASAEKIKIQFKFQANSYRNRRVLSFAYLGCQILRKRINIPINWDVFKSIWNLIYVF